MSGGDVGGEGDDADGCPRWPDVRYRSEEVTGTIVADTLATVGAVTRRFAWRALIPVNDDPGKEDRVRLLLLETLRVSIKEMQSRAGGS